jgi:hypothetical protein
MQNNTTIYTVQSKTILRHNAETEREREREREKTNEKQKQNPSNGYETVFKY